MDTKNGKDTAPTTSTNFIRSIVEEDLKTGRHTHIITRFPPEPNGFPHIGHAQSIWLNFGLALSSGGTYHLRFDDTNPETEDEAYVEAFKRDIRWLGYDWDDKEFYASDYFEQLYEWAVDLIKQGKAYVDDLDEEQIREYRGTVTEPGRESPYRDRTVEENLDLFERMRDGEFPDGARVLRAKIDMAHPNMLMRDPLMYRIRHAHHYRQGDKWHIYPLYDWAHGQSDAIENITHSVCTLEFEVHRPLYDWFLENLGIEPRPHQYEFARLNLNYTLMSKRKLRRLVEDGHVAGWDDPRMPTISGLRRRGVTPDALLNFCELAGVTKVNSRTDIGLLEYSFRDDLNYKAQRVMGVLRPLKVTITNYPEDETEWLDTPYWPHDIPREGTRKVPFSREVYIEQDDFMEDAPKGFRRLVPGGEVRLRYAYIIRCDEVIKNDAGEVVELRCSYYPEADHRVQGTIHWVSAEHAVPAEVRLYDRLFSAEDPDEGVEDFMENLNPESMVVLEGARLEPSVKDDAPDTRYQFERQGYFWRDPEDSQPDALVFNRIVSLRDTWSKRSSAKKETPKPEASKPKQTVPSPPVERRDPVESLTPEQKARFTRFHETLDLDRNDAVILAEDADLAAFFEAALAEHDAPQSVANWIVNELLRELKDTSLEDLPFDAPQLGRLVALIDDGTLSSRTAKDVFAEMMQNGGDPAQIVEQKNLSQLSDQDLLSSIVEQMLAAHPDEVTRFQAGKTDLMNFFVGQVMRETRGKANPQLVQELVQEQLA